MRRRSRTQACTGMWVHVSIQHTTRHVESAATCQVGCRIFQSRCPSATRAARHRRPRRRPWCRRLWRRRLEQQQAIATAAAATAETAPFPRSRTSGSSFPFCRCLAEGAAAGRASSVGGARPAFGTAANVAAATPLRRRRQRQRQR
eukprot:362360-Chlamydomonas_euryale.AAC.2